MRGSGARVVALLLWLAVAPARAGEPADDAVEAMRDYLMFAEATAGVIGPGQIDRAVFEAALFVDTRPAKRYAEDTIPGAINIDWRQVLDRLDEIPSSRPTILFCDSGALSAQAVFALRVVGRTNVLVLRSGLDGWRAEAAWKP